MKTLILAYVVTLLVMVGLDFVWLGKMGDAVYRPIMGDMALPGFRAAPAILFYLLYIGGAVYFAVAPALASGSVGAAALNGLLFGLCAYGTYDLTNHATLRNWSWTLTSMDMGWGAILTAIAASAGYLAAAALAARA